MAILIRLKKPTKSLSTTEVAKHYNGQINYLLGMLLVTYTLADLLIIKYEVYELDYQRNLRSVVSVGVSTECVSRVV